MEDRNRVGTISLWAKMRTRERVKEMKLRMKRRVGMGKKKSYENGIEINR
jgi:hypothetical protein